MSFFIYGFLSLEGDSVWKKKKILMSKISSPQCTHINQFRKDKMFQEHEMEKHWRLKYPFSTICPYLWTYTLISHEH